MSSGIGAYAPRYMQEGGEANMTSGLDAAQGSSSSLTPQQIAALNALGTYTGSAGRGAAANFQGASGYQGGANTQALPNYLSFDGNLVSIAPTATNSQFIDLLNDLGFLSDQKVGGKTDYEWFQAFFADSEGAGEHTWMSQLFNDPNADFNVDESFVSRGGFNESNVERFRRIAAIINPASQSGGVFQAPQTFLNNYSGGLGLNANRGNEDVARPRQVFIGQRPTGLGLDPNTGQPSAQQPYYTQSDVLVDSTEQPNLYTYNVNPSTGLSQFDPMNVTTTVNPYGTPALDLSTSYTPSETTPLFESDVDFSDIFSDVVTPDQVREFYRTYLGRDPGPNQYVMQFVQSGKPLNQIEMEIMNSPEAQNFAITGTAVSSAEELAQITAARTAATTAVTPEKVRGFYQQYLGRDPGNNEFVMGWVNSGIPLADLEAQIAASPEAQNFAATGVVAVTPTAPAATLQTVQDLYQKNLGRQGAEEYVMNWVNSGMSLDEIDQNIQNSPEGLSYSSSLSTTPPAGTTPVDTTASVDTTAPPPTTNQQGVPIGPTGLTTTQAAILAFEERRKKEEAAANTGAGGFALGGIVDLTDGMSLEANSGQGLESFLRDRSRATLRRNLAKLAPRPTDPASTMQQGIMPMAR